MIKLSGKQQSGQVVIMGLLVMVSVLAIALSVIGESLNEVSTATKTADSARAFSAAEGGVEQALSNTGSGAVVGTTTSNNIPFGTAQANVQTFPLPDSGMALLYPDIDKTSYAQFWFADPDTLSPAYNPGFYTYNIYFGDPTVTTDPPALEIRMVYNDGSGGYLVKPILVDSSPSRVLVNRFQLATNCDFTHGGIQIYTDFKDNSQKKKFLCQYTVNYPPPPGGGYPVMARVRILYSNAKHPIAIEPSSGYSLPPQVNLIKSTGTVGNIQRVVQVFQQKYVMPPFFDYVLFSGGILGKS